MYIKQKLGLCVIFGAESNTDNTFWDKLQDNIDNIWALYNPNIHICGDLNACFNSEDIDTVCDNITDFFLNVAKATIPNKTVTKRPADKSWV